jgi:hypothetical protein
LASVRRWRTGGCSLTFSRVTTTADDTNPGSTAALAGMATTAVMRRSFGSRRTLTRGGVGRTGTLTGTTMMMMMILMMMEDEYLGDATATARRTMTTTNGSTAEPNMGMEGRVTVTAGDSSDKGESGHGGHSHRGKGLSRA